MAPTRSATHSSYVSFLLGLVLTVAVLSLAKQVIIPLAMGVLLTFTLTPIVIGFQKLGLKRIYAVLVTVVSAFLIFSAIGWGVFVQIRMLAVDLPEHKKEIKDKVESLRGSGDGTLTRLVQMVDEITNPEETPTPEQSRSDPNKEIVVAKEKPSGLERLFQILGPVLEPLASAGLVLILVIFMLIKREDLRNRLIGLIGHGRLIGTTRVFVDAAQRLSRFLLNLLLINAGFGMLFGIGLFLLGVPYAFLWAFLTAVLRFVPYLGTWIAAACPLLLSIAMSDSWTQPILVLAYFAILDVITAQVVEPLLFGHSTGVSPIALIVAAAFWTWLWGPMGLVLSTPLTVCLVVLGQHVPRLSFLKVLLGDQPGLAPHANYYQRLLARDAKEAKEVVHRYVAEENWETVFDQVFLPALLQTRRDRKAGGLTVDEEEYVYHTSREILNDLPFDAANGSADEPLKPSTLLLGCPAHHPAEELSLSMLAHLLRPAGSRVEVMSTKVLPIQIEKWIEQERPALVFVAILPPDGVIQARYLCKRLRKRFAELPIVVGYWGQPRSFDKLLIRLRSAGASYVMTSLLQSRSQVLAMAGSSPAQAARSDIQPAGAR